MSSISKSTKTIQKFFFYTSFTSSLFSSINHFCILFFSTQHHQSICFSSVKSVCALFFPMPGQLSTCVRAIRIAIEDVGYLNWINFFVFYFDSKLYTFLLSG